MSNLCSTSSRPGLRTGWVWVVGALTAMGPLSIDMYLPAFPAIEQGLSAIPGSIEMTLASYFVGMAVGQLFYGPLSDHFGRKPPLYIGLALYLLASLGCMVTDGVESLTVLRLIQGLGGCAGAVIARAIVRDRCGARDAARLFSLLILVMGLAPMLAPLLGAQLLAGLGWRSIFAVLALFSLGCLGWVFWYLPESHNPPRGDRLSISGVVASYGHLMRSRGFIAYTLSGGLVMAGMFAYIAGSPSVLIQLHGISPQHYAWYFGFNALGFVVASQLNAWLLGRFSATQVLRVALWLPAVSGVSTAILAFSGSLELPLLMTGLFISVSSVGFINPNANAAALATHGQQAGTASALMGAIQFLLAMLAGMAVGLMHDGTAMPLSGLLALTGVLALLCNRCLIQCHREHECS